MNSILTTSPVLLICALMACAGADKSTSSGDTKVGFGQNGGQGGGDVIQALDGADVDRASASADIPDGSKDVVEEKETATDAKSEDDANQDVTGSDASDVESSWVGDVWENSGDQWSSLTDSTESVWDAEDFPWDGSNYDYDANEFWWDGSNYDYDANEFWWDGSNYDYDGMYYDTNEFWWDGSNYDYDGMYYDTNEFWWDGSNVESDANPYYWDTSEWSYGDIVDEPWDAPTDSDASTEYPYTVEFPDVSWNDEVDGGAKCTNCTDACASAAESCKTSCNGSCIEFCGEDYTECLGGCAGIPPCQAACSYAHGDCLVGCDPGYSACDAECDEYAEKCVGDCPCE